MSERRGLIATPFSRAELDGMRRGRIGEKRGRELGQQGVSGMIDVIREAATTEDPAISAGMVLGYSLELSGHMFSNQVIRMGYFGQLRTRLNVAIMEVRSTRP